MTHLDLAGNRGKLVKKNTCMVRLLGTLEYSASSLRSHYLERGTNYFFLFSHPEFENVVGILIFSACIFRQDDLQSNEQETP